jgi:hypothetical protein
MLLDAQTITEGGGRQPPPGGSFIKTPDVPRAHAAGGFAGGAAQKNGPVLNAIDSPTST